MLRTGIVLISVVLFSACEGDFDPTSASGKAAIIDEVNNALTAQDCTRAIERIEPLYASDQTDNEVRLLRSSAYACAGGFNFLQTVENLTTSNVIGNEFWRTLTRLFPAARTDTRMESNFIALESVLTPLLLGAQTPIEYQVFPGSRNPGSVNVLDRIPEANAYLPFLSMAVVGNVQNRYGKLDSQTFAATYAKLQDLPWTTSGLTNAEPTGCSYASAVVNMVDGINAILPYVSSNIASTLSSISTQFETLINRACKLGCAAIAAADPDPLWTSAYAYPTGCTFTKAEATALCGKCPLLLRSRQGCAGEPSDVARNAAACAAAGIVIFVNEDPLAGWQ